jgi:LPXTG-motif cell wall-anchored protein
VIGTKTRRGMAFLAVAAVLFMPIGLAPAANAEPDYPPSFYKISAERYTATIGARIQFTAQTFRSGSAVTVDVTESGAPAADSATVTANRKGIAKATVTFTVEGINTVTMSGTADDGRPLALSADVTVTAEDVQPVNGNGGGSGGNAGGGNDSAGGIPILGGGLPRTGGEIAGTALVAAALIGLGALLVVFTRRRRTS